MPAFLAWENQADADTSLAAVEAIYELPYTEASGYFMNNWDFVTQSDTTGEWGFYKPQERLGKLEVDLMAACEAGYTEEGGDAILLSEFFDTDGAISLYPDWSVIDEGSSSGPSSWSIASGQLLQTANIHDNSLDRDTLPKLGTYFLYDPSINWIDYHMQLDFSSADDDGIGVMFRYQDSNNYYRFSMDSQRAYRRIIKNEAGVFTLLIEDAVSYVEGQTYALEIAVEGSSIIITFDGTELFSITDTTLTTGGIAVYSWANPEVAFDNILITEL